MYRTEVSRRWPLSRLGQAVCAALVCLCPPLLQAEHLPDAAAHIGTLQINQGDQFTANPTVALAIQAVNNGSGVTLMQFSNDGQTWSAPEPYQTSRAWQLAADGVYPPGMSTVLKTVYVRFQDGTGTWSKAVTDSIVLARTAADIPPAQEIWIAQQTPPDFDPTQNPGSRQNPYLVPAPPNEPQFDAIMHSLMLAFRSYAPEAVTTNLLPLAPTNTPVPTVHLGPGVYQTHGDNRSLGDNAAWSPQSGWRLIGAGKDLTMLQMVDLATSTFRLLHVLGGYYGSVAHYDNLEISDLTIDANLHEGGGNVQNRYSVAIVFVGNNIQLRRLRVKNFGTTIPGAEGYGLGMQNFGAAIGTYNLIIEDCDFVQAQVGNAYKSGMMGVSGEPGEDGNLRYYYNAVIRNCYVDGAAYDGNTLVDPMLYKFDDRGRYGLSNGGCIGGVVEDCLVINVVDGFYIDSTGLHDVSIRNNHFRNVFNGVHLVLGGSAQAPVQLQGTLQFAGNRVELDPRLFRGGDNYGSLGWRYGFLFWGNLKGPADYSYNQLVVASNLFQFTDQLLPEAGVGGITGRLQAFRNAWITNNVFLGLSRPLEWDNDDAFLDRQADFVDPTRSMPLVSRRNTRDDGTIVDVYPYVLDKSLPRPVVRAGDEIAFAAPTLDGLPATVASGVSPASPLDDQGNFRWQTGLQDAGRYVLGFHHGTNRLSDPLYTMLTILPRTGANDPQYFANGLVGYWRLGETAGQTLQDSSGNGIDISATSGLNLGFLAMGVPGFRPGQTALGFSANPACPCTVLMIPNADPPTFTSLSPGYHPLLERETSLYHPFTISLWFRLAAEPRGAQLLFTDDGHFFLDLGPGPHTGDNKAVLTFSAGNNVNCATPESITVGVWHQATLAYDGVSFRLYLDGAKSAELAFGQVMDCTPGSRFWIGGGWGWQNFVGSMAELAIWNRVWSDAEIARLYTERSGGTVPALVPNAPSGLNAQSDQAGSVSLVWQDNSLNEAGFVLERSPDNSRFSTIASLGRNATNFLDTLPLPNGTYFYRVAATNESGYSPYSPVAIVGPCDYVLDSAGTNCGADGMSGSFYVSATAGCPWSAVVAASSPWIHTTSTGAGSGAVLFKVDTNGTSAVRSGIITVQGREFTISQAGAFTAPSGMYSALLDGPDAVPQGLAGLLNLKITTKRAFSGNVKLGARTSGLSGRLDGGGHVRLPVRRSGLPAVTLDLQMGPLDPDAFRGTLSDGSNTVSFNGSRAVYDGRTKLAPQAGRYTFVIPGQAAPGGDSFGTVTVDKAGRVRTQGTLAEGTRISQSAFVSKAGQWLVYVPLYRGKGVMLGRLNFAASAVEDLNGTVDWIKPAIPSAKVCPEGFNLSVQVTGSGYVRPPANPRVLPLTNALVVLSGGNLVAPLNAPVAIGPDNRVTDVGGNKVRLTFSTSSGLFRGSWLNPATGKTLTFSGGVLQKANCGAGFFTDANRVGKTYLGPPE